MRWVVAPCCLRSLLLTPWPDSSLCSGLTPRLLCRQREVPTRRAFFFFSNSLLAEDDCVMWRCENTKPAAGRLYLWLSHRSGPCGRALCPPVSPYSPSRPRACRRSRRQGGGKTNPPDENHGDVLRSSGRRKHAAPPAAPSDLDARSSTARWLHTRHRLHARNCRL